ncbi:MAG: hypothetical protein JWQ19_1834 [Subtercola sp.]|nr:hypothetical protein [Subtercola sp.]
MSQNPSSFAPSGAETQRPATAAEPGAAADLESTLSRLRGALSRSTVERVMTRAAAVFGLLLSLQAIPVVTGSSRYVGADWLNTESIVALGALLLVVVAAIAQRFVRTAMLIFCGLYLAAFIAWPLCVVNLTAAKGTQPWLWSLIAVAMAYAAIALPVWWAAAYIVVVTSVYVVIHIQPSGGAGDLKGALLDAVYVLLIGAFMVMLVVTLRRAAGRVDDAQSTAMHQYARAVGNQAAEVERTRMDALVHDSVLSTLITAARAETETERIAAVRSAEAALKTLQFAPDAFDSDADVTLTEFGQRLEEAVHLLSPRVAFSVEPLDARPVPGAVADALFSATVQALINSLQHASVDTMSDSVLRTVSVHATSGAVRHREVTVQVSDTGVGFDLSAVPRERLGLRVSIRERVESVGGGAAIHSLAGGGTSVIVTWREGTS